MVLVYSKLNNHGNKDTSGMTMIRTIGPSSPLEAYFGKALAEYGHQQAPSADVAILSLLTPDELPETVLARIESLTQPQTPLQKLIVLSSAEIYGEGDFTCGDCGPIFDAQRKADLLAAKRWEVFCPICGEMLMPIPITETSPTRPITAYGQALLSYEQAIRTLQSELNIPVVILRLFEPYCSDQAVSQAIASRIGMIASDLLNQRSPILPEDGYLIRDITHGQDVIQAIDKAIASDDAGVSIYNIGSGQWMTLFEMVSYLQEFLGKTDIPFQISEMHQPGDVRHRLANISKVRAELGYQPQYGILTGLEQFARTLLSARAPVGQEQA